MTWSLDIWCLSRFSSNGHNQKVHMHMVDLMSSIICEGDTVSQELLDTVLVNLVPAHKVRKHCTGCRSECLKGKLLIIGEGSEAISFSITLQFTETPAGQVGYCDVL